MPLLDSIPECPVKVKDYEFTSDKVPGDLEIEKLLSFDEEKQEILINEFSTLGIVGQELIANFEAKIG